MKKFDIHCPSWALPREEIPVHIKINKDITPTLKNVKIDLYDYFELKDTINLMDFEMNNGRIIVTDIGKAKKSNFDYFGIIIATKTLFSDDLKKEIPINVEFEFNDGRKEKSVEYARIFRPLLEFAQIPKNIMLSDNDGSIKIPISLKFIGFGDVNLRIECKIGGKIVSVGTSMLDEILRRIINEGVIAVHENEDTNVTVDKNYVEKMVLQLKEKFKTDEDVQKMIREQQIKEEKVELLYELAGGEKEKFMHIFFKTVEGYLIKIISDVLKRNISDNLQIESQTKIHTSIQLPSTDVAIRLFYKDVVGNQYDPIDKTIEIIDKRRNPSGLDVEIPLEIIQVDESNAYKNVGEMNIGTHR